MKTTLVFLDFFTPAYKAGGPIRIFESVARECTTESSVRILTQDTDWGDSKAMPGIESDRWVPMLNTQVFYASRRSRSCKTLRSLCAQFNPHSIHLNSLMSRTWTLKILILRRLGLISQEPKFFLSPHGELASSALNIKSHRKRAFLLLGKWLGLFSGVIWIATTEKERDEIALQMGDQAKIVISRPPLPAAVNHLATNKQAGTLQMVFLARVSKMKNISFIFDILPMVRGKVTLHIYGPIDPDFQTSWERLMPTPIREIGQHIVEHKGPVTSQESQSVLAKYQLFIQPSLSENFGFSIVEALASGTPVLISDQTPWNAVNSEKIGYALSLEDRNAWINSLDYFVELSDDNWQTWSRNCQAWLKRSRENNDSLLEIYKQN